MRYRELMLTMAVLLAGSTVAFRASLARAETPDISATTVWLTSANVTGARSHHATYRMSGWST